MKALPPELAARARLIVIGRDKSDAFQRMAMRLGLKDRVTFFTDGRDDIPRFLFSCDALVHPAYDEAAGMVIVEAMLAGLPALVTRNCGYAKYLSEQDAGIVLDNPFSQEVMNRELVRILTSDERQRWKENGLRASERKDLFEMVTTAVDLLETFARRKRELIVFAMFPLFPVRRDAARLHADRSRVPGQGIPRAGLLSEMGRGRARRDRGRHVRDERGHEPPAPREIRRARSGGLELAFAGVCGRVQQNARLGHLLRCRLVLRAQSPADAHTALSRHPQVSAPGQVRTRGVRPGGKNQRDAGRPQSASPVPRLLRDRRRPVLPAAARGRRRPQARRELARRARAGARRIRRRGRRGAVAHDRQRLHHQGHRSGARRFLQGSKAKRRSS